jgi:hypothetical protein
MWEKMVQDVEKRKTGIEAVRKPVGNNGPKGGRGSLTGKALFKVFPPPHFALSFSCVPDLFSVW